MIPIHLGDFPAGASVFVPFATFNAAGASISLVDFVLADIRIYKNGGVTQRTSSNGIALLDTDGVDFDGVVGLNGFSIDLSDNSDAGFYELGSEYWVVVTPVTIDSQAVSFFAATFSMGRIANVVWDEVLTGATHNVATSAGRRVRTLQDFGQYEGGLIWIDTVGGTAGTTDGENGTVRLPVKDEADMDTLLASIELPGVHVVPGSALVLESAFESLEMMGIGYTLALAGFSIDDSHIFRARVSGISLAANRCGFHNCNINTASVQKARFTNCGFGATVTFTLAGSYDVINCHSEIPGPDGPTFAKTAGQAITAQWRYWSGSINITGLEVGDTLTISGQLGTVDLGSPAGAVVVEIRGTYKEITNVGSASLNLDGAIQGSDVASIKAKTDDLTYTKARELDSNVQSLNGTTLVGDGSATPWGP